MYIDIQEPYRIEYYSTRRVEKPAEEYLHAMKPRHVAKALRWLDMLEQLGPALGRPYADLLDSPVRELRPSMEGHQHRFLYVIHARTILMTNAFLKKSARVPESEIALAMRRYADWLGHRENS